MCCLRVGDDISDPEVRGGQQPVPVGAVSGKLVDTARNVKYFGDENLLLTPMPAERPRASASAHENPGHRNVRLSRPHAELGVCKSDDRSAGAVWLGGSDP